MYTFERAFEENPSFSSTLLDKIYRSVDESDSKNQKDLKFYRGEPMQRKQSKGGGGRTAAAAERNSSFQRVSLVEKWMERKAIAERKELLTAIEAKARRDQDAPFFSSTSSSSESSSGSFSPSETESTYGAMSIRSCFVPSRPKQVRSSAPVKSGKPLRTERTLFNEFHHSASEKAPNFDEILIKSKSRAMKIYNNLKKVKQPLSPGGRLASFINSLVSSASNTKKSRNFSSVVVERPTDCRNVKSEQVSACSTASSFSRSCLSKNSPATRERLRNGVKRTVKFYPVSVVVDEECRPCGQKSLLEKEEERFPAKIMAVSVPSAWKIGLSPTEKTVANGDLTVKVLEKSKRVEEMAREFLKEYHQNQKKISVDYGDEDEDDAASDCSSDLFELDHLKVIGTDKFRQELPVYETTHVDKNRAIVHGLIV